MFSVFHSRPTKTPTAQKSRRRAGRSHSLKWNTRLEVEQLETRWLLSASPLTASAVQATPSSQAALVAPSVLTSTATPLPKIVMSEATTQNAESVTVDYSVSGANVTSPLAFNIYRSDKPSLDASSQLIGTQTINPSTDPRDLTVAAHAVSLINGTNLPPNQSLPYIVVVADSNGSVREAAGSVNTAYFRTYELGVLAHGGGGVVIDGVSVPFGVLSPKTPAWEADTANELMTIDHYDDVIAFNWKPYNEIAKPGLAAAAGYNLYWQVVTRADQLAAGHRGDVVDLHFIGHSRGTVVVSQAMQDLVGIKDPALEGSYIKATLLDPHPANSSTLNLYSASPQYPRIYGPVTNNYRTFHLLAQDPPVVIPQNVKEAEVYYQHTAYNAVPFLAPMPGPLQVFMQMWGEGPGDGIINHSGAQIQWHNLTDVFDSTILEVSGNEIGGIGHFEVPFYYEAHVVDQGLA